MRAVAGAAALFGIWSAGFTHSHAARRADPRYDALMLSGLMLLAMLIADTRFRRTLD